MTTFDTVPLAGNRLLATLAATDLAPLEQRLQPVHLTSGQVLCRPHESITTVHFPVTSAVSILTPLEDGTVVEASMIGREGMVELPVFLGVDISPAVVICQISGEALRMPTADFRDIVNPDHPLYHRLHRYTHARLTQVSQLVACNRRHAATPRCATWMLLAGEGVGADAFPLTQQFLSLLLGVRRATVTVAAAALQRAGLIRYRPGFIAISDRAGLRRVACECYRVIRAEIDRVLA